MIAAASPTPRNLRWLFGPVSALLLGCGLAYMAVFGLRAVASEQVEAAVPVWSFLLVSRVASAPHDGATLLRFRSAARMTPGDPSLRRRIAQVTEGSSADERVP